MAAYLGIYSGILPPGNLSFCFTQRHSRTTAAPQQHHSSTTAVLPTPNNLYRIRALFSSKQACHHPHRTSRTPFECRLRLLILVEGRKHKPFKMVSSTPERTLKGHAHRPPPYPSIMIPSTWPGVLVVSERLALEALPHQVRGQSDLARTSTTVHGVPTWLD